MRVLARIRRNLWSDTNSKRKKDFQLGFSSFQLVKRSTQIDRLGTQAPSCAVLARTNRRSAPWAVSNNHGKPLTELELASRLRPYRVRPKTLWIDGTSGKGYMSDELQELFNRYVPKQMADEALARQVEPPEPPAAPVRS